MAVVAGCFTSPGEVLDAVRRGAEASIFEYPDTVPVAVGASKNWGPGKSGMAQVTAAAGHYAGAAYCEILRN